MALKRDFAAMEKRRFRAVNLLEKGLSQAEVARQTKVSRQSVMRWDRQRSQGGKEALRAAGRAGRKPKLEAKYEKPLVDILVAGPEAAGFPTPIWTLERVAKVLRDRFGVRCHSTSALRLLRDRLGWSCQKPVGRALERDEPAIARWKRKTWPTLKKKAQHEGRTLVFIDESGLTQKPHRVRTWSPKGQTPLLFHAFNWENLGAISGLTWWNFYFQVYPGAIRSAQVIEFLTHLQRHLKGRLLIIWDGAGIHRSKMVREYLESLRGKILAYRLPAYAPELNPVEYLWSYWKQHELPNVCARDLPDLAGWAIHALRRVRRRRKRLIQAFWKQAELW